MFALNIGQSQSTSIVNLDEYIGVITREVNRFVGVRKGLYV